MRALTLTQPWAGLVASGIKLVENRPRRMVKAEDFGKPFAIHASREIHGPTYDRIADLAPELIQFARNADGGRDLFYTDTENWFTLSSRTSAVIGVATIDRVFEYEDPPTVDEPSMPIALQGQARWMFGPVCYLLRDVLALDRPVLCRGWQGFWTLPSDVARAVTDQLA